MGSRDQKNVEMEEAAIIYHHSIMKSILLLQNEIGPCLWEKIA